MCNKRYFKALSVAIFAENIINQLQVQMFLLVGRCVCVKSFSFSHCPSFANFFSIFVLFHCSPFPSSLYTTICSFPLTHPSVLFMFVFLLPIPSFHVIVTLPSLSFHSYSSHPSVSSFFPFPSLLLPLFSFISPSSCYISSLPFLLQRLPLSDHSALFHLIHLPPLLCLTCPPPAGISVMLQHACLFWHSCSMPMVSVKSSSA